jgi:hypothetical protein
MANATFLIVSPSCSANTLLFLNGNVIERALLQVEVDEHSLFNTAELFADADKSIV